MIDFLHFLGTKAIRLALLLFGVSLAAFLLMSASPMDPLRTNVGQLAVNTMSEEQVEKLENYWGVHEPLADRYMGWLSDAVRGDLGTSLLYRQPVVQVLGSRLKNSLLLMLAAWGLTGLIGVALGILSGATRGRLPDRLISGYCLMISSTPAFWVALLLMMIFSVWLGLLPVGMAAPIGVDAASVSAAERVRHAILPAVSLSMTGIAPITLHTRGKMCEVMDSDYILFARARGESCRSVVLRHGLRNVMLPAITIQFASISEVFGGSILIEQVFSFPGLGQTAVTAALGADMPLLLGITVLSSVVLYLGNLAADICCWGMDPRRRRGRGL